MPNLRGKTWTTTTPANVEDAQYWEDHLISDEAATKAASSVQSVNNTTPDASGNVDIVALPSGGTVGQVLTKQSSSAGDADWEDPASSGHTIEDEDGTTMPYQETLQFVNAEVTNDTTNSKTVVDCKGSKGDPGQAASVVVGTTSTLPAGSNATVTNSGTSLAAVLDFGIPKGTDGTDGTDGVGITGVALISTSGKVKTYRISFSDSSYFDFQVTDGADGTGAGDMLQADYDPTSAVYNAGGIVSYVASQAYDLPVAASGTLGGVKVGTNLSIDSNGVLSATVPTISSTYSGTSTDGMSGVAVKSAIDALDGSVSGAPGAGKTLTAFSESNGVVSATFDNISITKSQVSDFPQIPNAANNAALYIQQNGVSAYTGGSSFNADSSSPATANIITSQYIAQGSPSSGSVSFTVDDTAYSGTYGFDVYFDVTSSSTNLSPYAKLTSITGEGTSSMVLTYETDADNGTNTAKLYLVR